MTEKRESGTWRSRRNGADCFSLEPSDIGQSMVRLIVVTCVVIWSLFISEATFPGAVLRAPFTILSLAYWLFSIAYAGWSYILVSARRSSVTHFRIKRIIGVVADLSALSAYTAIAGPGGIVLFPIFLTTIVGYGLRFGLRYLYFAIAVGLTCFSGVIFYDEQVRANVALVLAYYIGIILVPLYVSSLLKKHADVLSRLKELNLARSRFIANMSHEFRTPLHAVISLTDTMKEQVQRRPIKEDSFSSQLEMVSDSAEHLLSLVNKVLEVASADAGVARIEKRTAVDLFSSLRRTVNICAQPARNKQIRLTCCIGPAVPQHVFSIGQHIDEILINVVGNAVKYTKVGSVHLAILGGSNLQGARGDLIRIEVTDTGIGISGNVIDSIFEPFVLGDDTAERSTGGTGLGLTITKSYVEQLGGNIVLQSTPNVGTRCVIELPLQEAKSPLITRTKQCLLFSAKYPESLNRDAARAVKLEFHHLSDRSLLASLDLAAYEAILLAADDDAALKPYADELFRIAPDRKTALYFETDFRLSRLGAPFVTAIDISRQRDLEFFSALLESLGEDKLTLEEDSSAQPKQLLIADDNPTNLRAATLAVEPAGHKVITVKSGEAALDALENQHFDLAILDMQMPELSGMDVARLYSYMAPNNATPIILLTADATPETKLQAERAGVRAVLTKPIRPKDLRKAVAMFSRIGPEAPTAVQECKSTDSIIRLHEALVSPREIEELRELGASAANIAQMISDFAADTVASLDRARVCAMEGDAERVKECLHAMRGAAATIGAVYLKKKASNMERTPTDSLCGLYLTSVSELTNIVRRTESSLLGILNASGSDRNIQAAKR